MVGVKGMEDGRGVVKEGMREGKIQEDGITEDKD